VRASKSRKLIAFISGVPIDLRIRKKTFRAGEVNFLCVHKKLREKRLAPVLIKEITRRINLDGIFQAIYTAGVVLPTPVSTCRYFHRTLDFEKLNEINFSAVPPRSTVQRQVLKYRLPPNTAIQGLRPFEEKDISQVKTLMNKYLKRFDMAQEFTVDDVDHWLLHKDGNNQPDQVVWTYVVETNGKITDFVSFYRLESTVIKATVQRNKLLKAAYLYYYATDAAFDKDPAVLENRLQALIKDALTLAKKVSSFNLLLFPAS
jgi:glycylpeptide N-tetradecanoyltransferase